MKHHVQPKEEAESKFGPKTLTVSGFGGSRAEVRLMLCPAKDPDSSVPLMRILPSRNYGRLMVFPTGRLAARP